MTAPAAEGGADRAADATSWGLIAAAADGRAGERAEFARRYAAVVRAYLAARWRGSRLAADVDDAVQEVFVDCFRPGGVLARAVAARPARFRAYIYGVTRMTARRIERERAQRRRVEGGADEAIAAAPSPAESLSRVFDRAWASAILRAAAKLQDERAAGDPAARRRVELLLSRFRDGLAVREIAARWNVDPAWLHHQFASARDEYRRALADVVRREVGPERVDAECARLLEHFS